MHVREFAPRALANRGWHATEMACQQ